MITFRTVDGIFEEFKDYWCWSDGVKKKTGLFIWGGISRIDRLTNTELHLKGDFYNKTLYPELDYQYDSYYSFELVFAKDKDK